MFAFHSSLIQHDTPVKQIIINNSIRTANIIHMIHCLFLLKGLTTLLINTNFVNTFTFIIESDIVLFQF